MTETTETMNLNPESLTNEQGMTCLRNYIRMFDCLPLETLRKMSESSYSEAVSLWKNSPDDKESLMVNWLRQTAIGHQVERRYDQRHGYSGRTFTDDELRDRVKHARICSHSRPITCDFQ